MFPKILAALLLLLSTMAAAQGQPAANRQDACRTTEPPNPLFVPPAPYPPNAPDGRFWYGTDALWTMLSVNDWWTDNLSGKGFVTKLVFWRRGFNWRAEREPALTITARRLDGDTPPVAFSHASAVFVTSDTPAMMTGIRIPIPGCWELTARYAGHTLSFVVGVVQ